MVDHPHFRTTPPIFTNVTAKAFTERGQRPGLCRVTPPVTHTSSWGSARGGRSKQKFPWPLKRKLDPQGRLPFKTQSCPPKLASCQNPRPFNTFPTRSFCTPPKLTQSCHLDPGHLRPQQTGPRPPDGEESCHTPTRLLIAPSVPIGLPIVDGPSPLGPAPGPHAAAWFRSFRVRMVLMGRVCQGRKLVSSRGFFLTT